MNETFPESPNPQVPVRTWGNRGPMVFALHGGPAARGSAAPMARGLADAFRVVEPWQRGSSEVPLTVARHVEDLHGLVLHYGGGGGVGVVGESWGAMLALCYAAAHPETTGPVALVGCGTFDPESRAEMTRRIEARTTDAMRCEMEQVERTVVDPAKRMKAMYDVIMPIYDHDAEPPAPGIDPQADAEPFDAKAHTETWNDMLHLQAEGVYPQAFRVITSPVLMIHGAQDPHPGQQTFDLLKRFIKRLDYVELPKCGHRPWVERQARDRFFETMTAWLTRRLSDGNATP